MPQIRKDGVRVPEPGSLVGLSARDLDHLEQCVVAEKNERAVRHRSQMRSPVSTSVLARQIIGLLEDFHWAYQTLDFNGKMYCRSCGVQHGQPHLGTCGYAQIKNAIECLW